ncbi:MAG: G5 domain-containing protein [Patescibacteria group bacterium]|jgi:uncharacterized protein YabE (DUF348 family)
MEKIPKKPNKIRLIILIVILIITVVFGTLIITDKNHVLLAKISGTKQQPNITKIIVKDKNDKKEFTSEKETLQEALQDNNIKIFDHDIITPNLDTKIKKYTLLIVDIQRKYAVTIIDKKDKKEIVSDKNVVKDILKEQNIKLIKEDNINPNIDEQIENNSKIIISRANLINIFVDGQENIAKTHFKQVDKIIAEAGIKLNGDDYTIPESNSKIENNAKIEIIRVTKKEEITKEEIPFETEEQYSDQMYEDEQNVSQVGKNGILEKTYEIRLENDKEVDKKLVSEEKTLEPQNKIIVYGTKKHPQGKVITGGRATYYYGPTIAACNLFPKGTKLRVTNVDNGQSIEVIVDDTGGFGWPTVIDLRQDYFEKIGGTTNAGIINVTIEEIL